MLLEYQNQRSAERRFGFFKDLLFFTSSVISENAGKEASLELEAMLHLLRLSCKKYYIICFFRLTWGMCGQIFDFPKIYEYDFLSQPI
jgi:hypothetical protein